MFFTIILSLLDAFQIFLCLHAYIFERLHLGFGISGILSLLDAFLGSALKKEFSIFSFYMNILAIESTHIVAFENSYSFRKDIENWKM